MCKCSLVCSRDVEGGHVCSRSDELFTNTRLEQLEEHGRTQLYKKQRMTGLAIIVVTARAMTRKVARNVWQEQAVRTDYMYQVYCSGG